MKIQSKCKVGILALCAVSFLCAGWGQAWADDHGPGRDGFWDNHHHYRHYEYYHHHRGYWDNQNGLNVWINLG
jgi:hypothetical protein